MTDENLPLSKLTPADSFRLLLLVTVPALAVPQGSIVTAGPSGINDPLENRAFSHQQTAAGPTARVGVATPCDAARTGCDIIANFIKHRGTKIKIWLP